MIDVSIISHNHGQMVVSLVNQLLGFPEVSRIIITFNVLKDVELPSNEKIKILINSSPLGFGANHNKAYLHCNAKYFVVLNPDVEFIDNPFATLLSDLSRKNAGIISPLALSSDGDVEDNWRKFPTLKFILIKLFNRGSVKCDYFSSSADPFVIEWASGLMLMFTKVAYSKLDGFDERYFMYYEDVDLCFRAAILGINVYACPSAKVIHHARRASRKQLKYSIWHIASMTKFLLLKYFGIKY